MVSSDTVYVKNVSKEMSKRLVLDDVTVTFGPGKIYGLSGPNGSGKTMLLRAIAGLIHPDRGEVIVFGDRIGRDVSFPSKMGLTLGAMGLFADKTGLDNLRLLASVRGLITDVEIRDSMARVGLDPDDRRLYGSYSLGMKQRLCIAQAIMERPKLILLDEPTNALDFDGKNLVRRLVRRERDRGATIIVASHDKEDLDYLCEAKYFLYDGRLGGDGRDD